MHVIYIIISPQIIITVVCKIDISFQIIMEQIIYIILYSFLWYHYWFFIALCIYDLIISILLQIEGQYNHSSIHSSVGIIWKSTISAHVFQPRIWYIYIDWTHRRFSIRTAEHSLPSIKKLWKNLWYIEMNFTYKLES